MRSHLVAGFTLVEVLVAVLVLAIGILGAAGAQVAALRTRQGTGLMSGGVQLASALADHMRANAARESGAVSPYLQLAYDADADGAPVAPGFTCYAGSACTAAQMAAFDVHEAKLELYTRFPGGRIVVCRDATVWAESRRALSWECAGDASAPVVIKLGWRGQRTGATADGLPPAPALALVVGGSGS
ncbi:MAG: type IV pilus modification protein PilV [Pseudomonadota bacterium]